MRPLCFKLLQNCIHCQSLPEIEVVPKWHWCRTAFCCSPKYSLDQLTSIREWNVQRMGLSAIWQLRCICNHMTLHNFHSTLPPPAWGFLCLNESPLSKLNHGFLQVIWNKGYFYLVIYASLDMPGQRSRYNHSLRAGESGDRIPVREIFRSHPGRPWGPIVSCKMGNGFLSWG